MTNGSEPLLRVEDLQTHFFTRAGVVKAVDGITFDLKEGETLGIVGESGSGKSMTALSIMRLVPEPGGRIVGGRILFQGEDLVPMSQGQMSDIRGRDICMVLQDPMTSLNPVLSVGDPRIWRAISRLMPPGFPDPGCTAGCCVRWRDP